MCVLIVDEDIEIKISIYFNDIKVVMSKCWADIMDDDTTYVNETQRDKYKSVYEKDGIISLRLIVSEATILEKKQLIFLMSLQDKEINTSLGYILLNINFNEFRLHLHKLDPQRVTVEFLFHVIKNINDIIIGNGTQKRMRVTKCIDDFTWLLHHYRDRVTLVDCIEALENMKDYRRVCFGLVSKIIFICATKEEIDQLDIEEVNLLSETVKPYVKDDRGREVYHMMK